MNLRHAVELVPNSIKNANGNSVAIPEKNIPIQVCTGVTPVREDKHNNTDSIHSHTTSNVTYDE